MNSAEARRWLKRQVRDTCSEPLMPLNLGLATTFSFRDISNWFTICSFKGISVGFNHIQSIYALASVAEALSPVVEQEGATHGLTTPNGSHNCPALTFSYFTATSPTSSCRAPSTPFLRLHVNTSLAHFAFLDSPSYCSSSASSVLPHHSNAGSRFQRCRHASSPLQVDFDCAQAPATNLGAIRPGPGTPTGCGCCDGCFRSSPRPRNR
jgi:hypothetical protein